MILFPTFNKGFAFILTLDFIFLLSAILLLASSASIVRKEVRYDSQCGISTGSCSITFTLSEEITDPKVYYRLENFYGNHKNYVESRNFNQLRGDTASTSS